jgi:hypothetical protein
MYRDPKENERRYRRARVEMADIGRATADPHSRIEEMFEKAGLSPHEAAFMIRDILKDYITESGESLETAMHWVVGWSHGFIAGYLFAQDLDPEPEGFEDAKETA